MYVALSFQQVWFHDLHYGAAQVHVFAVLYLFRENRPAADPAAGRIVIFITGTRQDDAMECAEGSHTVCWFCRKGRHGDCMGSIPHDARSDGPHDCTFDTDMVPCGCGHCSGAPN